MERLKHSITYMILAAFLLLLVGGSMTMRHDAMGMEDASGCPFSVPGFSICAQNNIAAAMHHVAEYRSFLTADTTLATTLMMLALVASAVVLVLVSARVFVASPPAWALVRHPDYVRRIDRRKAKLARYTALHENSPFHR